MRSSPAITSNVAATAAGSPASIVDGGINGNRDDDASSVADSEGSVSSLVAFDLQEDLAAEQWWGPDGLGPVDSKALTLRTLAAALRKQDDLAGALEALSKVGMAGGCECVLKVVCCLVPAMLVCCSDFRCCPQSGGCSCR
jgi:hypothetical protein